MYHCFVEIYFKMLIVLCYKYLIMHVHIVQSDFHVRHIPFRGITARTLPFPISWSPPPLVRLPPHGGLLIRGPGNGALPPSKSSPYAIIYNPRAETKHTSKVYDAAPLNDRLGELIRAVIFILINHGCCTKLGTLQGFHFFSSIHEFHIS